MLCGLPAGDASLLSPVTMLNILGDSWKPTAPDWQALLHDESAHLHLYEKSEARAGRKMGHINCLADTPVNSVASAENVRRVIDR